jgi:hypothetical protein
MASKKKNSKAGDEPEDVEEATVGEEEEEQEEEEEEEPKPKKSKKAQPPQTRGVKRTRQKWGPKDDKALVDAMVTLGWQAPLAELKRKSGLQRDYGTLRRNIFNGTTDFDLS